MRFHWLIVVTVAGLCAGCPAEGEEVRPPADSFYFPTGQALSPAEDILFVANANSDLRFDSGMVLAVDIEDVAATVTSWLASGDVASGCEADPAIPYTLNCDEREFVLDEASVRIGNFATEIRVQELDSGDLRLFVAVRGDPSLSWIDYSVADRLMTCGGGGSYPQCDDDHRLTRLRNDTDFVGLTEEPFGLFVDSANGYALITHLSTGTVTLADAPPDGSAPILADALGGLFAPDPVSNIRGAVGVAGRAPGSEFDTMYVTSRSEARVQMLYVIRPALSSFPTVVSAGFFFLTEVQPADDSRGIAFSQNGDRMFVVNRDPPLIHVVDTSLSEVGVPRNKFLGGIEVCREASNLVVGDVGRGDRIYVGCFQDGQIWVIDPSGFVVDAITEVGRGPTAVVLSTTRNLLFVTNFLEDTIAVVDLAPGSVTENRVVLRLGRARQEEDL